MKHLAILAACAGLALASLAAFEPFKTKPNKAAWWFERLERNKKAIAAANGAFDLVMIGDSITHHWERCGKPSYDKLCEGRKVLNAGYGADGVWLALWRLQNGELDGYKAKTITLMLGTNNFNVKPLSDVAKAIELVLKEIEKRQPQATVLLYAIFPRGEKPDAPARKSVEEINRHIKKYADGKRVIWCDLAPKLLQADGTIRKDLFFDDCLHPNAEGYKVWLAELEERLQKQP